MPPVDVILLAVPETLATPPPPTASGIHAIPSTVHSNWVRDVLKRAVPIPPALSSVVPTGIVKPPLPGNIGFKAIAYTGFKGEPVIVIWLAVPVAVNNAEKVALAMLHPYNC